MGKIATAAAVAAFALTAVVSAVGANGATPPPRRMGLVYSVIAYAATQQASYRQGATGGLEYSQGSGTSNETLDHGRTSQQSSLLSVSGKKIWGYISFPTHLVVKGSGAFKLQQEPEERCDTSLANPSSGTVSFQNARPTAHITDPVQVTWTFGAIPCVPSFKADYTQVVGLKTLRQKNFVLSHEGNGTFALTNGSGQYDWKVTLKLKFVRDITKAGG